MAQHDASLPGLDDAGWAAVDRLVAWLDGDRAAPAAPPGPAGAPGHGPDLDPDLDLVLLRVLKLAEEVGEVSQALIGVTGQNPRKGVTHTWDDVRAELCDVAITALVALRSVDPAAPRTFGAALQRVLDRAEAPGPPRGGMHGQEG